MTDHDWCPLHGSDGAVCDCLVEAEPTFLEAITPALSEHWSGVLDRILLANAVSEACWQRHDDEGTHVIGDVSTRQALDALSRESQHWPDVSSAEAAAAVKAARREGRG